MTHAELGQAMIDGGAGVWSAERWTTFWSLPPDDQQAMATIAQDGSAPASADVWGASLKVAETIATVAGDVVGLGSGIEAIRALVKTL